MWRIDNRVGQEDRRLCNWVALICVCLCVQVHIEFTDGEERISLEGPTEEVEQAQAQIQEIIKDLVSFYTYNLGP